MLYYAGLVVAGFICHDSGTHAFTLWW